jgi:hypothetical protein
MLKWRISTEKNGTSSQHISNLKAVTWNMREQGFLVKLELIQYSYLKTTSHSARQLVSLNPFVKRGAV